MKLLRQLGLSAAVVALAALAAASLRPAPTVYAGEDPSQPAFFTQRVAPILNNNCARCHGGFNHRGAYSMNTRDSLLKGGHHGPALVPGHPEQSALIASVQQTGNDQHPPLPMPPSPRPKLSDADLATLLAWVRAGAPTPPDPLFRPPE